MLRNAMRESTCVCCLYLTARSASPSCRLTAAFGLAEHPALYLGNTKIGARLHHAGCRSSPGREVMAEIHIPPCPLCSGLAALLACRNGGKYKVFDCDVCGEFAISDRAQSRIAGLPRDFKDKLRTSIQSVSIDKILLITVEPVGSGGGLQTEPVHRSSLRL